VNKTIKYSSLPEDMQIIIMQFLETDLKGKIYKLPDLENLPLVMVDVNSFMHTAPLDKSRGKNHAEKMSGQKLPPIIISHGRLLDGRHRLWIAKKDGIEKYPAIDLTKLMPWDAQTWFDEPIKTLKSLKPKLQALLDTLGDVKKILAVSKPQVWYHGISYDLVDRELVDGNYVGWFSESKEYAKEYTHGEDGGKVYKRYLDIRNPYIFPKTVGKEEETTPRKFEKLVGFKVNHPAFPDDQKVPLWYMYDPEYTDFVEILESKGYDGLQTVEFGHKCILPFREDQIRVKAIKKTASYDNKYPSLAWIRKELRFSVYAPTKRKVLGAFIIGSEAKGVAHANSDLDIGVIVEPVRGKTALQLSEEYHNKFSSDEQKPSWNGRRVDFQFFYPNDPELNNYSKIKVTASYNDSEEEFDYPLTDEDMQNIQQADKVTSDEATDASKIPHPEHWEDIEGRGMFFIGGDAVNVNTAGEQTPFGIDYPNYFKGWAVGKNRLAIFEKKAQEGYYYVGVILYPNREKSAYVNPAFLNALNRKLKEVADGLEDVSYKHIKEEAHKQMFSKKLDKDEQPKMFGYLGEHVPEDINFYRKVIDLLKSAEKEQMKRKGQAPKESQTVYAHKILSEVADAVNSGKHKDSHGKIVGVGKFAEGLRGEDRVVKHEVYPEEVIFSNYVELPEPIDVTELISAIGQMHPNVEEKYWLSTIYTRLQGYNLTMDKNLPMIQELMDIAERGDTVAQKAPMTWEGLKKTARLQKTANLQLKSRDGSPVMFALENLKDIKQRENFLKHYMNGTFEVDGAWHHDLEPLEQSKLRIHYNNLKYL